MKFFLVLALATCTVTSIAAPQTLLTTPLESPDGKLAANVQWDAVGFIGRIRMLVYGQSEAPAVSVELPQIKPAPANLSWISDEWVACESFVAENAASFCYLDVPRKRAYMVEIFAPEEDKDWIISYTTNDSVSSDSIATLSRGQSSLFPILFRDLPNSGLDYLSPDFAYLLSDAVDSFVDWRKKQKFSTLKFLSPVAERPNLGRLIVAAVDNRAEIIYFPQGTTSTREMLALTQRQPLPESAQKIINGINPPELSIEWTSDRGDFHVLARREDHATTSSELVVGRFEGVSDTTYTGPGIRQLLGDNSSGEGKTKITPSDKSRSGSSQSKAKSDSKSSGQKGSTSKPTSSGKSSSSSGKKSSSSGSKSSSSGKKSPSRSR